MAEEKKYSLAEIKEFKAALEGTPQREPALNAPISNNPLPETTETDQAPTSQNYDPSFNPLNFVEGGNKTIGEVEDNLQSKMPAQQKAELDIQQQ